MKKIFLITLLFLSFLNISYAYETVQYQPTWDDNNSQTNDAWESNFPTTDTQSSWDPNSPDFVWPPEPKQEGDNNNSWCNYTDWDSVAKLLDWCKPKKVVSSTDMKLETWFKKKVNWFITNLMVVLWIIAVWAIVYAWWLMQFSAWEDEQINKAKNIIKWTIIWFLLLISASWIVYIVINVMFWLWWG